MKRLKLYRLCTNKSGHLRVDTTFYPMIFIQKYLILKNLTNYAALTQPFRKKIKIAQGFQR
jgi:hypothetical protein